MNDIHLDFMKIMLGFSITLFTLCGVYVVYRLNVSESIINRTYEEMRIWYRQYSSHSLGYQHQINNLSTDELEKRIQSDINQTRPKELSDKLSSQKKGSRSIKNNFKWITIFIALIIVVSLVNIVFQNVVFFSVHKKEFIYGVAISFLLTFYFIVRLVWISLEGFRV